MKPTLRHLLTFLTAMALTACSEPSATGVQEKRAETSGDVSEPTAEASRRVDMESTSPTEPVAGREEAQPTGDPTLIDLKVPSVAYVEAERNPEAGAPPAEPTPLAPVKGYRYPDIPGDREAQIALRENVRTERRELQNALALRKREIVSENTELTDAAEELEDLENRRSAYLASTPEMKEMDKEYAQLIERFQQADTVLKERLREQNKGPKPGSGSDTASRAEADAPISGPAETRDSLLQKRRRLLIRISVHRKDSTELENQLHSTHPELARMEQRVRELRDRVDAAYASDARLASMEREILELTNKEIYITSLVTGDPRYVDLPVTHHDDN